MQLKKEIGSNFDYSNSTAEKSCLNNQMFGLSKVGLKQVKMH